MIDRSRAPRGLRKCCSRTRGGFVFRHSQRFERRGQLRRAEPRHRQGPTAPVRPRKLGKVFAAEPHRPIGHTAADRLLRGELAVNVYLRGTRNNLGDV